MNTHDTDMDKIKEVLRESLSIEVKTESRYTGGMAGGDLYRDSHTIILLLDGKPISEAYL